MCNWLQEGNRVMKTPQLNTSMPSPLLKSVQRYVLHSITSLGSSSMERMGPETAIGMGEVVRVGAIQHLARRNIMNLVVNNCTK